MFQLRYTRPDGTEGGRGADHETTYNAALAVLSVLVDEDEQVPISEAKRFAKYLYTEPIGAEIKHEPSGIIFNIVEV